MFLKSEASSYHLKRTRNEADDERKDGIQTNSTPGLLQRPRGHEPAEDRQDEATASLDPENETLIQRAVGALCAGKTVIVIAHRLRTIANADKIVVLDDGNIVEEGTHDDLVSSNGLYRHLWDLQLRSSSWGADGRMSAEGTQ